MCQVPPTAASRSKIAKFSNPQGSILSQLEAIGTATEPNLLTAVKDIRSTREAALQEEADHHTEAVKVIRGEAKKAAANLMADFRASNPDFAVTPDTETDAAFRPANEATDDSGVNDSSDGFDA